MNSTKIVGIVLFILGVFVFFASCLFLGSTGNFELEDLVKDSYVHVTTALLTISLTILVIDHLNSKREIRAEKEKTDSGIKK